MNSLLFFRCALTAVVAAAAAYTLRIVWRPGHWEAINVGTLKVARDRIYRVTIITPQPAIAGFADDTVTLNTAFAFIFSHQLVIGHGRIDALMDGEELTRFLLSPERARASAFYRWIGPAPTRGEGLKF